METDFIGNSCRYSLRLANALQQQLRAFNGLAEATGATITARTREMGSREGEWRPVVRRGHVDGKGAFGETIVT